VLVALDREDGHGVAKPFGDDLDGDAGGDEQRGVRVRGSCRRVHRGLVRGQWALAHQERPDDFHHVVADWLAKL
jgi:hypothetical protein